MKTMRWMLRMLRACALPALLAWSVTALSAANPDQDAFLVQQKFFQAIQVGNPDKVIELLHQDLVEEVDRPVLHAWMTAVKEHLGDVKSLNKQGFRGAVKYDKQGEKQVRVLHSKGKVPFAQGTALSELWVHEGKIIRFEVTSDKIPDKWIREIQDTELYRQEGAAFLKVFLDGDDEKAFGLEHETFRKVMPRKRLKEMSDEIKANVGPLKKVTWKSEAFDIQPDKYKLKIRYKVDCEKESTIAVVEFQFLKMQAWIVGFDLTGKGK